MLRRDLFLETFPNKPCLFSLLLIVRSWTLTLNMLTESLTRRFLGFLQWLHSLNICLASKRSPLMSIQCKIQSYPLWWPFVGREQPKVASDHCMVWPWEEFVGTSAPGLFYCVSTNLETWMYSTCQNLSFYRAARACWWSVDQQHLAATYPQH